MGDQHGARLGRIDEPGRFVAIPGYEWSGNTALGGDRNVFYRHEGRPIFRSSHALVDDLSDLDSDRHTAAELLASLDGEDAIVVPHVGGRYSDEWHVDHLLNPQALVPESVMPRYPWLAKTTR